jgi:hypothetical protein
VPSLPGTWDRRASAKIIDSLPLRAPVECLEKRKHFQHRQGPKRRPCATPNAPNENCSQGSIARAPLVYSANRTLASAR